MADITATLNPPTKASQQIERVKRELYRRSNDKLKVHNPTEQDFRSTWDGFAYTVKAKSDEVLPRYIANNYIKHMIDSLIGQENAERVRVENEKRVKSGQKPMDAQEREVFDLKRNDENLRRKYLAVVYKGLVEAYGVDTSAPPKSASADSRPLDERLMDEIGNAMESEPEANNEPPPLKVNSEDFGDEEDITIPIKTEVDDRKEELLKEAAE